MLVCTDNLKLVRNFLGRNFEILSEKTELPENIIPLHDTLFLAETTCNFKLSNLGYWNYLFLVKDAVKSHFDIIVELNSQSLQLPDGIVCIAETGNGFHGFRKRNWNALQGNLHISLFFKPKSKFKNIHAGVLIASAVSIIETIDSIPGLAGLASTKWVNDILINNSKVSGIITQTSSIGNKISAAMIGIGLNVLTTPVIEKDRFTPKAACLKNFTDSPQCNIELVLNELLNNLSENIKMLNEKDYSQLFEKYCSRSAVIGKTADLYSDPLTGNSKKIFTGKIIGIRENLELIFENSSTPVRSGRLSLHK
jgi:BirA family biotin operon repressor/biotin-[acetyl-CoA-carboxylase] ligase